MNYKDLVQHSTSKHVDLSGSKYNKLTLIELLGYLKLNPKGHEPVYKCLCECGNETVATRRDVKYGNKKSCGCLRELNYKRFARSRNITDIDFYTIQLYKKYKHSAKRRRFKFRLTLEEFSILITDRCSYCGRKPYTSFKYRPTKKYKTTTNLIYNGIDRIDNAQGYISTNVTTCCKECNMLKGKLSDIEFIKIVALISDYQRKNSVNCWEACDGNQQPSLN